MKASYPQQLAIFGVNRFFNTTQEKDEKQLQGFEGTAKYQDERVLKFMKEMQRPTGWTSCEIQAHFPDMLLTSVRRSLNNLMKDEHNPEGTVEQTGEKRKGTYGMNVLIWRYKQPKI